MVKFEYILYASCNLFVYKIGNKVVAVAYSYIGKRKKLGADKAISIMYDVH